MMVWMNTLRMLDIGTVDKFKKKSKRLNKKITFDFGIVSNNSTAWFHFTAFYESKN